MLNLLLAASAVRPKVPFFQLAEVGGFMLISIIDESEGETSVGSLGGIEECTVIGVQSQSGVSALVAERLWRVFSTRVILIDDGENDLLPSSSSGAEDRLNARAKRRKSCWWKHEVGWQISAKQRLDA